MIYFDNAATSFPKSGRVVKAVASSVRRCGNPGRSGHAPSMRAADIMFACREKAACVFGTDPERVIITPSCTLALNMAIKGFINGGRVLISNLEHNAVCRPLYALRDAGVIELDVFDALSRDVQGEFARKVKGASAAVFTHGSNVCGRLLPLFCLVREAKKRGVFTVVDAAQSAGYVGVSLEESGADVICCAGHKGPGGPMGIGLMLVNRACRALPRTLIEGGTGVYSRDEVMPAFYPERLEAGTPCVPAAAGLSAALDEFECGFDLGPFELLKNELRSMRGVTLYGVFPPSQSLPVLLFNVDGMDCDAVMNRLARRGICVRSGFHCAPLAHKALGTVSGGVRVSLGKRNTVREVKRFCVELQRLIREPR